MDVCEEVDVGPGWLFFGQGEIVDDEISVFNFSHENSY